MTKTPPTFPTQGPLRPFKIPYTCGRGHRIETIDDLYIPPGKGWYGRVCRACINNSRRAWRARQRAAKP